MYCSYEKLQKTGAVLMVLFSWVTAFDEAEDKTLNLKIGFDLTQGQNGSPSLRIRNFEEVPDFRRKTLKSETKKSPKKAVRAESSSEEQSVEENSHDKITPKVKGIREGPLRSDDSDDADTSGSDDDRRLSTKGLAPDEFEPERRPNIHGRYKGSDTE